MCRILIVIIILYYVVKEKREGEIIRFTLMYTINSIIKNYNDIAAAALG